MVGVSTALSLQRRGYEVALIDRKRPGLETSYGNAGFIQREAVRPYAFPRDWKTLFRVVAGQGNHVNYHLSATLRILPTLTKYWRESSPARYARTITAYAALIEHSISEHTRYIVESESTDLIRRDGWLEVYRSKRAFDEAVNYAAEVAKEHGLNIDVYAGAELQKAESALSDRLAGAVHWRDSWTVDGPGDLVQRYSELFERNRGKIYSGDAQTLQADGPGWSVLTDEGEVSAQQAVVCLGPWSAELIRPLGYDFPLFIKRGYHRHYDSSSNLRLPLLDAERGYALVPMARGLRITTGAEFADLASAPTPGQLFAAERYATELVKIGAPVEATPWLGARPCIADMLPVIGPAWRHPGLWFHFGHGHQGFTLGPATARLLAELVSGETPYVDAAPYSPERFA